MKLILKGPFEENVYSLMRKIGYHFVGKNREEYNFIKPIGGDAFPRFDIYLKIEDQNLVINLHLDQKRPIYKSTTAHSGEYEGDLVQKEMERIKQSLQK